MTNEQIAGRQIKTITLDHVSSEEAGLQGAELEMKEQYGHMALMVVSVQEDSPLCKQGQIYKQVNSGFKEDWDHEKINMLICCLLSYLFGELSIQEDNPLCKLCV